jgi:hypothetical protein
MDPAATAALVDAATKKAGLVWVRGTAPALRPQAVWHLWSEGALFVLTGGIEQPPPAGLEPGGTAWVTVPSKDKGSRLVTYRVAVDVVAPDQPAWADLVPALVAKRLNLPDGEAAPQRWAAECTLWRLTPTGEVAETPDEPSTSSHAAEPPLSPARSRVPRPLHLRGRPRRNKGGR